MPDGVGLTYGTNAPTIVWTNFAVGDSMCCCAGACCRQWCHVPYVVVPKCMIPEVNGEQHTPGKLEGIALEGLPQVCHEYAHRALRVLEGERWRWKNMPTERKSRNICKSISMMCDEEDASHGCIIDSSELVSCMSIICCPPHAWGGILSRMMWADTCVVDEA